MKLLIDVVKTLPWAFCFLIFNFNIYIHACFWKCSGEYIWLQVNGRREVVTGPKTLILLVGRMLELRNAPSDAYGMISFLM